MSSKVLEKPWGKSWKCVGWKKKKSGWMHFQEQMEKFFEFNWNEK